MVVPMMFMVMMVTMLCVALQRELGLKLQMSRINPYRGIVSCNRTSVVMVVPMMIIVVMVTMLFAALQQVLGLEHKHEESIHTAEASVASAATARVS